MSYIKSFLIITMLFGIGYADETCEDVHPCSYENIDCPNNWPGFSSCTGDLDGNGQIDVVDIQQIVFITLGWYIGSYEGCGDMTGDGEVNVLDCLALVSWLIYPNADCPG